MKEKFTTIAILGILLSSCSSIEEPLSPTSNSSDERSLTQSINKSDALKIADKVLGRSASTRNIQSSIPEFEYVLNERSTRNSNIPDTLAYIINYPNDEGFVIVSSDRRVYPVLAFSKESNFRFDNEIARDNFISNIGAYMEKADESNCYDVTDFDVAGCYAALPTVKASLSQRAPWDKYVIKEYPGCPVGCVAVATALVISHSIKKMEYHGSTYYLKSIVNAINKGQNSATNAPKRSFYPFQSFEPEYTYEEAVDSMAKFLYWIGKDVNMKYGTDGSSAFHIDAYDLCTSLGLLNDESIRGFSSFDIIEITRLLKNDYILYLGGYEISGKGGHAWVSDGCHYCVDQDDKTTITETYIHCDWGWGGNGNGYYSGSVFSVSSWNFKPTQYFAIKRYWDDFITIPFAP